MVNILGIKSNEVYTVDIHNYKIEEAKKYLERLIVSINPEIKEIFVIHGYHRGDALQNMVRNDLKSKRISKRILSLNPGVTSLIIEPKEMQ